MILWKKEIQCWAKATEHQTYFDLFVDFIEFALEFAEPWLQNNWKSDKTFYIFILHWHWNIIQRFISKSSDICPCPNRIYFVFGPTLNWEDLHLLMWMNRDDRSQFTERGFLGIVSKITVGFLEDVETVLVRK